MNPEEPTPVEPLDGPTDFFDVTEIARAAAKEAAAQKAAAEEAAAQETARAAIDGGSNDGQRVEVTASATEGVPAADVAVAVEPVPASATESEDGCDAETVPCVESEPECEPEPSFPEVSAHPVFSVIMPCYNSAPYIDAAVDAMEAQTFTDWELICVDDGSPDDVSMRIHERAMRDSRVRLVRHRSNQGLAAARNTGLVNACGYYVWMPDPDDTYESDTLELVNQQIEAAHPDVVVFGAQEEYFDAEGTVSSTRLVHLPFSGVLSGDVLHRSVLTLEESTLYGYAWNKVYRASALREILFEDVPLIEDILFNVRVFDHAGSVAFVPCPLYHYAKREQANLTNRFVPEYYDVHRRRISALFAQQCAWGLDTPDTRSRLGSLFVRYIVSALERNCDSRSGMKHADRIQFCEKVMHDELFRKLALVAEPRNSRSLAYACRVMRSRSAARFCRFGRLVHIVKRISSPFVARIKAQR